MSDTGCSAETTEPYALRVIGDSMLPEFENDHIIIVDPSISPYQGAYVVLEQNNEVLFGQFRQNGTFKNLHYLNDNFPAVALDNDFLVKGVITQRSNGRRKSIKHYEPPADHF